MAELILISILVLCILTYNNTKGDKKKKDDK